MDDIGIEKQKKIKGENIILDYLQQINIHDGKRKGTMIVCTMIHDAIPISKTNHSKKCHNLEIEVPLNAFNFGENPLSKWYAKVQYPSHVMVHK